MRLEDLVAEAGLAPERCEALLDAGVVPLEVRAGRIDTQLHVLTPRQARSLRRAHALLVQGLPKETIRRMVGELYWTSD